MPSLGLKFKLGSKGMAISLPNELWYEILSYLPDGEPDKLMSVNRVFYECAWDRRYKEVSLLRATPYTIKRAKMLRDPKVAPRVRSLVIQISSLDDFEYALRPTVSILPPPITASASVDSTKSKKKKSWLASFLRAFFKPKKSLPTPSSPIQLSSSLSSVVAIAQTGSYPNLVTIFKGLTNVRTCAIHWKGIGDVSDVPPLLGLIWYTMRLRELSLRVGAGGLHVALAGVPPVTSLHSISITFLSSNAPLNMSAPNSNPTDESIDALVKLVNASRNTLTSLQVRCHEHLSLDTLFSQLEQVADLTTFQLRMPCTRGYSAFVGDPGSALFSFLQAHNDSLRHLSLDFPGLTRDIFSHIKVTNLLSLEITPYTTQTMNYNTSAAVQQLAGFFSQRQLTNLVILGVDFNPVDLMNLLGDEGHPNLLSLRISITQIDKTILALLIRRLPCLQELMVTITGGRGTDEREFGLFITKITFPEWSLYDLTIQDTTRVWYFALMAVATVCPTIRSFCGSVGVYEATMKNFESKDPFGLDTRNV